jgi:hypothetical protein
LIQHVIASSKLAGSVEHAVVKCHRSSSDLNRRSTSFGHRMVFCSLSDLWCWGHFVSSCTSRPFLLQRFLSCIGCGWYEQTTTTRLRTITSVSCRHHPNCSSRILPPPSFPLWPRIFDASHCSGTGIATHLTLRVIVDELCVEAQNQTSPAFSLLSCRLKMLSAARSQRFCCFCSPKTVQKARWQGDSQEKGPEKNKNHEEVTTVDEAAGVIEEKRFLQCVKKCRSQCCHLCLEKMVAAMERQNIHQSEFRWMEYAKQVVAGKGYQSVPASESHCCRFIVDATGPTIKLDHNNQARGKKTESMDGALIFPRYNVGIATSLRYVDVISVAQAPNSAGEGLHLVLSPSAARHCEAKKLTMKSGPGMLCNTLADIRKPIQLGWSTAVHVRLTIMGYVDGHTFEKGETITKESIDKNPKIISNMSLLMSELTCNKERCMFKTNVWILLGGTLFLLCLSASTSCN